MRIDPFLGGVQIRYVFVVVTVDGHAVSKADPKKKLETESGPANCLYCSGKFQ